MGILRGKKTEKGFRVMILLFMISLAGAVLAEDIAVDAGENGVGTFSGEEVTYVAPVIYIEAPSKIDLGEEAKIEIKVSKGSEKSISVFIYFGDGKSENPEIEEDIYYYYPYKYSSEGEYKINVTVNDGTNFTTEWKTIKVIIPDNPPTIKLVYPLANAEIKSEDIGFRFEVSDDKKVEYCDFEVYVGHGVNKTINYSSKIEDPLLNNEYLMTLKEFEDLNYTWQITCEDNKSQKTTDSRKFSVKTQAHSKEKEINKVIDDLEKLISEKNSFSAYETEILENVGLIDDLKEKISDLKKINSGLALKPEDKSLLDEYLKVNSEIPSKIEFLKEDSYMKNSLSNSFEERISEYLELKNSEMGGVTKKFQIDKNKEIQGKLTVSTNIKRFRVSYPDKNDEFTYVKKSFKYNLEDFELIEFLPNEDKLNVISPLNKEEKFYWIDSSDLKEKEIVYYFEKNMGLAEIERTETFFYKEFDGGVFTITGFVIFEYGIEGKSKYLSFGILASLVLFLVVVKRHSVVKIPDLKEINNLLKEGINFVKIENVDDAKKNYKKIRELYNSLDKTNKKIIFEKLNNLKAEIDRREMRDFIKEYKEIKRKGDVEEAKKMYEKIKEKYTQLPKKYQKKVYERVILAGV